MNALKLYETRTVRKDDFEGEGSEDFYLVSGSRLLVTLRVIAITGTPTVTLRIENAESSDVPFDLLETLTLDQVGVTKAALVDFNMMFKLVYEVEGGSATIRVSAVAHSNAIASEGGGAEGAATAAKQDTGNASLSSIDTKLTSQATAAKQDVGNTSLGSIDTKVATATKQDTGNTSLSSIDTKLTSQATAVKQDIGNVSLASIDGKVATEAKQDTAITALGSIDTKMDAQATAIKQDTGNTSLDSIDTKLSSQATAAKQDSIIEQLETLNSLVPAAYDHVSLVYTGDNLTSVVFKIGGSGGTIISTLTLAYTGDRLDSVDKS